MSNASAHATTTTGASTLADAPLPTTLRPARRAANLINAAHNGFCRRYIELENARAAIQDEIRFQKDQLAMEMRDNPAGKPEIKPMVRLSESKAEGERANAILAQKDLYRMRMAYMLEGERAWRAEHPKARFTPRPSNHFVRHRPGESRFDRERRAGLKNVYDDVRPNDLPKVHVPAKILADIASRRNPYEHPLMQRANDRTARGYHSHHGRPHQSSVVYREFPDITGDPTTDFPASREPRSLEALRKARCYPGNIHRDAAEVQASAGAESYRRAWMAKAKSQLEIRARAATIAALNAQLASLEAQSAELTPSIRGNQTRHDLLEARIAELQGRKKAAEAA